MPALKNGVLLRNKMKKTGKKRLASYLSFSAPCMAVTLFQFVVWYCFMSSYHTTAFFLLPSSGRLHFYSA